MNRMNRKDRLLLEELDAKYGADVISTAIMNAANNDAVIELVPTTVEPKDIVLDYLMRIEGYRVRLRELHWQAVKHYEHLLTDSLIDDLEKYEDSIAEDFMGMIGYRIKVGMLVPKLPKETELMALLDEIINRTINVKEAISGIPQASGMVTILDDAINMINKSKYLSTMA